LLTEHAAAVDSECIVAAALRLTLLAPGANHSRLGRAHSVAEHLAALAAAQPRGMTADRVSIFLGAFNALGAPYRSPAANSLLRAAAQAAALAPSVSALAVVVHGLRAHAPAPPEVAALAAAAAESLLACSMLQELPVAAVPVCAAALALGESAPPAALSALSHAACMHVEELSAQEIVEVIGAFVAAASSDASLLKLLAGAFHKRSLVRHNPLPCSFHRPIICNAVNVVVHALTVMRIELRGAHLLKE
jgi:hypothetical protein